MCHMICMITISIILLHLEFAEKEENAKPWN